MCTSRFKCRRIKADIGHKRGWFHSLPQFLALVQLFICIPSSSISSPTWLTSFWPLHSCLYQYTATLIISEYHYIHFPIPASLSESFDRQSEGGEVREECSFPLPHITPPNFRLESVSILDLVQSFLDQSQSHWEGTESFLCVMVKRNKYPSPSASVTEPVTRLYWDISLFLWNKFLIVYSYSGAMFTKACCTHPHSYTLSI